MSERPTAIDLQPVKGVRDFYPEDMRVRTWLFGLWREVARRFGYEEYDACVLESEELYIRKAGDEITSQLYNFADKGDRRVALRPELTPSLARMVMARGAALPLPARWFALPQCFRYENMQRGRKREHFQWNMDIVGLPSVAAEAELMAAQALFFREAGLGVSGSARDVVFKVSNRLVLQHVLDGLGITGDRFAQVCVVIDKRDKIGSDAMASELFKLGVADDATRKIIDVMGIAGDGAEGVAAIERAIGADNPGVAQLRELLTYADAFGYAHLLSFDLSVIRGLSYYTGTVWEAFDASGAMPRAIAGGGRYDRLVETFGGKPLPMAGFGMGDVVIIDILRERALLPPLRRQVDDVVYPMSAAEIPVANRIARFLRKQGRTVVVDYSLRRFKHVVERAEKVDGAANLYILGGNEIAAGKATVKPLGQEGAKEYPVALSAIGAG
jgi:histidyl-tRNA synthetase